METPETEALFAELLARCAVVEDLNGPQVEAFVSGLVPMFDDELATTDGFVTYCGSNPGPVSALVCAAMAELFRGDDQDLSEKAASVVAATDAGAATAVQDQIGASVPSGAWTVQAPFGRSIMLGFDNPAAAASVDEPVQDEPAEDGSATDGRHSVMVELDEQGRLMDLQLSGAAELMVDDAGSVDTRVQIEAVEIEEGLARIVAAWPSPGEMVQDPGPGIAANLQFVRHRIWQATGTLLSVITLSTPAVDVQRGLDQAEYAEANRAALSTLRAALGDVGKEASDTERADSAAGRAWLGVVRGDGGELSSRERDALLWLEWADWLGAGIGLERAGDAAEISGSVLVDHVNRCPEVSSSIDKADRDYAEWAFDVAIDLLEDAGAVAEGRLTSEGSAALIPALVQAWS